MYLDGLHPVVVHKDLQPLSGLDKLFATVTQGSRALRGNPGLGSGTPLEFLEKARTAFQPHLAPSILHPRRSLAFRFSPFVYFVYFVVEN